MSLPGDECDIPSASNVVTHRQSYEPDSDISHPAQPDSSRVESDDTPILSKEPNTDTAEVAEDVNLDSSNPEVPLDFLPSRHHRTTMMTMILAPYIFFFWKISLRAMKRTITVCF